MNEERYCIKLKRDRLTRIENGKGNERNGQPDDKRKQRNNEKS